MTDGVSVPMTIGMSEAQAVSMLLRLGLKAATVPEESHGSTGCVVAMSPPAGTVLERGSTVTIAVSTWIVDEEH
jgi:beta-lactam-binding protein with PASTA domain